MLNKVKNLISLDNPLRLLYHKIRAIIANVVYGFPHKDMLIIGITGTNGKTTTCNIVARGLIESGKKVFMFSTVNIIVNDEEFTNNTKMTSPDAFELQKWLAYAKNKGCEIAVIETASHGIKMSRIWGLNYDIVALTNISQDHLDLHKTMEDYVATKLEIFKNIMFYKRKSGVKKVAVINIDSDYAELFTSETYDTLFTYGKNYKANLQPQNIKTTIEGTEFSLKIPGDDIKIKTKLIGEFNVYNIMCAVGIFSSLGFSRELIEKAISKTSGIPGRMDLLESEDGVKIYIDYAHTEDALKNVLQTFKSLEGVKRIITVFGATGDRDKTKRPVMGQIVAEYSDLIILTEDDNYSEDVHEIMKDIIPGIERKEGEGFWIIPERKEAITTALIAARKGDIVLLAGKGDEHKIMRNNGPEEWHDKTIAQEILNEIKENKLVVKK
ncbi:MAG: UDP-N-acetylmuramoyl-L-alanyl-D-glutamate--2,6-diaminopimelate ligase [Candidatus Gracilibacteria bacterium]|nr:UDP-N-acetylmuramoyl-L-alanyl-D-glutamate--2,6-diaminopimelate ligase [Candidatus Gracilibacteria bacterium]MDQ7022962.1 UDP-N-acetylmuramoyl-L-alanyl-D-glutamate--2,6-diaminopimelate ligase [Candidatus Gracilibacteria bacterium]